MAETKTVNVPGIGCDHCVSTIERELGDMQGVTAVSVDRERKRVTVEWTQAGTTWDAIASHLDDIGYPVAEETG